MQPRDGSAGSKDWHVKKAWTLLCWDPSIHPSPQLLPGRAAGADTHLYQAALGGGAQLRAVQQLAALGWRPLPEHRRRLVATQHEEVLRQAGGAGKRPAAVRPLSVLPQQKQPNAPINAAKHTHGPTTTTTLVPPPYPTHTHRCSSATPATDLQEVLFDVVCQAGQLQVKSHPQHQTRVTIQHLFLQVPLRGLQYHCHLRGRWQQSARGCREGRLARLSEQAWRGVACGGEAAPTGMTQPADLQVGGCLQQVRHGGWSQQSSTAAQHRRQQRHRAVAKAEGDGGGGFAKAAEQRRAGGGSKCKAVGWVSWRHP